MLLPSYYLNLFLYTGPILVLLLTFLKLEVKMWMLTILYEGLVLCSMLAPTETIITGPTVLTPAKAVGSSRVLNEEQITSLHYSLNFFFVCLLFVFVIKVKGYRILADRSSPFSLTWVGMIATICVVSPCFCGTVGPP